jgi:thiol-disulfide isomerase/thioredoxin
VRRSSLIVAYLLLLTACSSNLNQPFNQGFVPNCEELDTSIITKKELNFKCLDNLSQINFHTINGPIVINVWGSWCEGCRDEMLFFIDLYQRPIFKSGQIKLLGVVVEESSVDAAKRFIKAYGMSWPHLLDSDGRSTSLFGLGVPVTYFLGEEGKILHKHMGAYQSKAELFNAVEQYFKVKL